MGQHQKLRCEDCIEYANVGKIWSPTLSQCELTMEFLSEHKGHTLRLVGEYGGTQEQWMEANQENGWTKFVIA